jgi:hypothetical protein
VAYIFFTCCTLNNAISNYSFSTRPPFAALLFSASSIPASFYENLTAALQIGKTVLHFCKAASGGKGNFFKEKKFKRLPSATFFINLQKPLSIKTAENRAQHVFIPRRFVCLKSFWVSKGDFYKKPLWLTESEKAGAA